MRMSRKQSGTSTTGFSRREFLLTVGAAPPTMSLMEGVAIGKPRSAPMAPAATAGLKFTPIDLSTYFNCSSREFGTREEAGMIGGDSATDSLIRVPGGKRDLHGIPFVLGPEDLQSKAWVVLSAKSGPTAAAKVEIPLGL